MSGFFLHPLSTALPSLAGVVVSGVVVVSVVVSDHAPRAAG